MLCSLKTSFHTNKKKKYFWERIHKTTFGDKEPNKSIVNAEVELRRSQKSRISKSFGPNFITYALESEPQIFKVVMSTSEAKI